MHGIGGKPPKAIIGPEFQDQNAYGLSEQPTDPSDTSRARHSAHARVDDGERKSCGVDERLDSVRESGTLIVQPAARGETGPEHNDPFQGGSGRTGIRRISTDDVR